MPSVVAYTVRAIPDTLPTAEAAVRAAVGSLLRLEDTPAVTVLTDEPAEAAKPLLNRPAGGRLSGLLGRGDVVFFTSLDAFADAADAANVVGIWAGRGVRVVVADVAGEPVDTADPAGRRFAAHLATFVALDKAKVSAQKQEVARQLREENRPTSGRPPYGFRIAGRKGNRQLVRLGRDEGQRAWGGKFVLWRDELGNDWHQIAKHLKDHGVTRPSGSPWTASVVKWTYCREVELRRMEDGVPTEMGEARIGTAAAVADRTGPA